MKVLYINGNNDKINNLSVITAGILYKILLKLNPNLDYIKLGYKNVKEWTNISESTYTKFLKEVKKEGILSDKNIKKGEYYVNKEYYKMLDKSK